ncbi:MAG: RHS repeat protein, partial [Planctomycetaceae bacterium]|nr:RHS repeat protein [Planctomycetaceae bacterium]
DPDDSDRPLLTLSQTNLIDGFWTSAVPDGFSHSVQIYASGATPGLLQPGETIRIPVYYAGLLLSADHGWDFSDNEVEFEIRIHEAGSTEFIDWNGMKDMLRPEWITPGAWDGVFANLTAQTGTTWGDYVAMLSENATYLAHLGRKISDVNELYAFELQQALGLSPVSTLASAIDVSLVGTGMQLEFGRLFGNSLLERYTTGPFGQGWSASWQMRLEGLPDGTVILHDAGGVQIRFQPDSRTIGKYFSPAGYTGVFRQVSGGAFELQSPNGTVTRFHANGTLDYVQDVNGSRITASHTSGRLTGLAHSSGASMTLTYNAAGRITSISDSVGRVHTYTYDPTYTYLLSVTGPAGTVAYTYDTGANPASRHALTSVTDPGGTTRHYDYDARGRLAATYADVDIARVEYSYDEAGTVTSTDAAGVSTAIFFDHLGRIARIEDALGSYVLYDYNTAGQVIRQTDSLGRSRTFTWCTCGSLTSMTDELGNTTTFAVGGPNNQPLSYTDALGNTTRYAYDAAGNRTRTTYADGSAERVTYDAMGGPSSLVNRRGQTIQFSYNSFGQLTQETFQDGTTVTYTYDARNRLSTATDASGTTTFTYDFADRLTRVEYPNNRWLEYAYDAAGRRTRLEDHTGYAVQYSYDAAGRLSGLHDAADALIVSYTYDAAGRLSREDKGNGTYSLYTYDGNGRAASIVHHAPDDSINSRFDYTYNAVGQRTGMSTLDGSWTYTYDLTGQLVHAVFDSVNPEIEDQDLRYFYDALGNRTHTEINGVATDYTVNNLNQYTTVGDTTYQYDLDGNLISQIGPDGTRTFAYNARNQLVRVTTPDGTWEYEYDAFGNRIATIANGERTEYLLDPTGLVNVIGEHDASGMRTVSYVYGLGLEAAANTAGMNYYDFNAIGSTVGLSGASGVYSNKYLSAPFGNGL